MLLHIATFHWKPGVARAQVDAFDRALATLPAQIPQLRAYHHGSDLGLREGNAAYGVVALLDGPETVAAYLDHPEHIRIVRELCLPIVAERVAVQITVTADQPPGSEGGTGARKGGRGQTRSPRSSIRHP